MEQEVAQTLSEYLESQNTTHTIRYTPNSGYKVRIPQEEMTQQIYQDIKHLGGKEPAHGTEYR